VPPVFEWLQRTGSVPADDMLRTFNMGIGLIVVCASEHAAQLMDDLARHGEPGARLIGAIQDGRRGVSYK
jgi:phosphoribosylformylglycinamidine cyclo-ligase